MLKPAVGEFWEDCFPLLPTDCEAESLLRAVEETRAGAHRQTNSGPLC